MVKEVEKSMAKLTTLSRLRVWMRILIPILIVASVELLAPPVESIDHERTHLSSHSAMRLTTGAVWAAPRRDCSSARDAVQAVRDHYQALELRVLSVKADSEGGHLVRVNDGRFVWDVRVSRTCNVTEV